MQNREIKIGDRVRVVKTNKNPLDGLTGFVVEVNNAVVDPGNIIYAVHFPDWRGGHNGNFSPEDIKRIRQETGFRLSVTGVSIYLFKPVHLELYGSPKPIDNTQRASIEELVNNLKKIQ
jgi:hypothetical protein